MLKRMFKFIFYFSSVLFLLVLLVDQKRKVHCISDNKCVTVWKRIGGTCYVMPYKYYGLFRPRDCYIITTNSSDIGFIWKNKKEIIVHVDEEATIVDNSTKKIKILDYEANYEIYDSIFTYKDGYYRRYKKNVQRIGISILENYCVNCNENM